MDIIEEVKKIIISASEAYKAEAEDGYDYWNEHIKYVYRFGDVLQKSNY